jgi:hypothetical protein
MSLSNYILDENNQPIQEPDIMKWGSWFKVSNDRRRVGKSVRYS